VDVMDKETNIFCKKTEKLLKIPTDWRLPGGSLQDIEELIP